MIEQPSRLEQLGQLFTAMIAVVLSGSSDLTLDDDGQQDFYASGELASPPVEARSSPGFIIRRMTPLSVGFASLYEGKVHGRWKHFAEAMGPFVEGGCYSPALILERQLRRLPIMPSSLRWVTASYMAMHDRNGWSAQQFLDSDEYWASLFSRFRDIRKDVSYLTGAEPAFISRAWRDRDGQLDRAWNALFLKLRQMKREQEVRN